MSFYIQAILAMSILPAAIAAAIRRERTSEVFLPFLIFLWLGAAHELIVIFISQKGYSHYAVTNIYCLAEALLIWWQFVKWDERIRNSRAVPYITGGILILWIAEAVFISRLVAFNSWFLMVTSLLIALAAIYKIADLSVKGAVRSERSVFLICVGLTLFSITAVLVEIFYLYSLTRSHDFQIRIYDLISIINVLVNLIYLLAVLWMPLKLRYILQSY